LYSFFTKGTIQQWEYGTSKEVAGSNPSVQPCFSMEQTSHCRWCHRSPARVREWCGTT